MLGYNSLLAILLCRGNIIQLKRRNFKDYKLMKFPQFQKNSDKIHYITEIIYHYNQRIVYKIIKSFSLGDSNYPDTQK